MAVKGKYFNECQPKSQPLSFPENSYQSRNFKTARNTTAEEQTWAKPKSQRVQINRTDLL